MFGTKRGALQTTKATTITTEALVYLLSLFFDSASVTPPTLRIVEVVDVVASGLDDFLLWWCLCILVTKEVAVEADL